MHNCLRLRVAICHRFCLKRKPPPELLWCKWQGGGDDGLFLSKTNRVVVLLLQATQFAVHCFHQWLHKRLVVEIVQFVRVVEQVVEFPVVDVVVEVYEFISAVAHAVVSLHAMLGRVFVEVIV